MVASSPLESDAWHPEYPLVDELDVVKHITTDPSTPFCAYLIRRSEDGLAIGGIGFFTTPDAGGSVEVGYGLVAAARGRGFATEALRAMTALAFAHGALNVIADTAIDNLRSQQVLGRAGFSESRRTEALVFYRAGSATATVAKCSTAGNGS